MSSVLRQYSWDYSHEYERLYNNMLDFLCYTIICWISFVKKVFVRANLTLPIFPQHIILYACVHACSPSFTDKELYFSRLRNSVCLWLVHHSFDRARKTPCRLYLKCE